MVANEYLITRSPEDPKAWDLRGLTGEVLVSQESFGVVSGIRSAIESGANGSTEFDEVARQILESGK